MPRPLRLTLWITFAMLWGSGCLWLVLHFGFEQHTEFGPLPNPGEAAVLMVHGWLAVAGVFLIGWIAGGHVLERWGIRRSRISGLTLLSSVAVLVVSGYALDYTTDRLQSTAAFAHELLGVTAILAALTHWLRRSRG